MRDLATVRYKVQLVYPNNITKDEQAKYWTEIIEYVKDMLKLSDSLAEISARPKSGGNRIRIL